MSSTLLLPGDELPMTDAREIQERLYHSVDAVIDSGNCGLEPTSVIDLEGLAPVVARRGKGDVTAFE
jgi:tRNA A37 threonylcarbamoyladenosine synthetase subunit TsaC/SUA5/YrdC